MIYAVRDMSIKTFELREDGERVVSFSLPNTETMPAKKLVELYAKTYPSWVILARAWGTLPEQVREVMAKDFAESGCILADGTRLELSPKTVIGDMEGLVEMLRQKGREDLLEESVSLKALRQACATDQGLGEEVKGFLRTTPGSLEHKGKRSGLHNSRLTRAMELEVGL